LRPLQAEPFDTAEHSRPRVDAKALATVRQNQYSVPVARLLTTASGKTLL